MSEPHSRAPQSIPAYLFDVYPHPRLSSLVVWIKQGRRVTKRLVPYQPDFCIRAEEWRLEDAERLLADDERVEKTWHDTASLWLRAPPEPVLRVRPKRLQDLFSVATRLRRLSETKGFRFYDVDNQPESRWMHEQGLWTMCRLKLDDAGRPLLEVADDEDRFTYDYTDPDLVTVHLEVRTQVEGNERDWADPLEAIRIRTEAPGPWLDDGAPPARGSPRRTLEIRCPRPGDDDSERATLRAFGRLLRRIDPDVVFTKHGDRFDIPYLLRRIDALGLRTQVWLGRDPDPDPGRPDQESKSIHTYGRWLFKTHAYYLRGRWHIDLSKKTLDSEDDRKDIHGILYLARVSNRRTQDCNRNGAGYALQQMQIDLAVDLGTAVPWKRNLTEEWKDATTLCAVDRGGQIMVPTPGVYGDVAACDFSGYYPSLVVRHNLSSDTITATGDPDDTVVPELDYRIHAPDCDITDGYGHQARVLARLVEHRRDAKAIIKWADEHAPWMKKTSRPPPGFVPEGHAALHTYDEVQKALAIKSEHKALGVVCFGYFRYRNARFGCAEVHQAIQCFGRDGMTQARAIANDMGMEMLHSMTDCAFFRPLHGKLDNNTVRRFIRRVQNKVGVLMDVEGIYRWVVFLPSKTHSKSGPGTVGVPNRYYGKFQDGTLKVRGIEVQRHSTPDWIHDVQQGMLDILVEADDPDGFLARIPRALDVAKDAARRLRDRLVDPKELGTMVQATREVEAYRAETNTKHALRRLRDAGTERKPGEYVKYVVARQEGPKESRVVPIELFGKQTAWFGTPKVAYHAEHYLRLLARSIETLLAPFGYAEDPVLDWLAGRADKPMPVAPKRVDVPARPEWVVA